MKEEIKNIWTAALRSGDYKRTTDTLKTSYGFCCLGVLCDVVMKAHPELGFRWEKPEVPIDGYRHKHMLLHPDITEESDYNHAPDALPVPIMNFVGMRTHSGEFVPENSDGYAQSLATKNDQGATFKELADIIDKYWENL